MNADTMTTPVLAPLPTPGLRWDVHAQGGHTPFWQLRITDELGDRVASCVIDIARGHISCFGVEKSWQGLGLARHLLDGAVACGGLSLTVDATNVAAVRTYNRRMSVTTHSTRDETYQMALSEQPIPVEPLAFRHRTGASRAYRPDELTLIHTVRDAGGHDLSQALALLFRYGRPRARNSLQGRTRTHANSATSLEGGTATLIRLADTWSRHDPAGVTRAVRSLAPKDLDLRLRRLRGELSSAESDTANLPDILASSPPAGAWDGDTKRSQRGRWSQLTCAQAMLKLLMRTAAGHLHALDA